MYRILMGISRELSNIKQIMSEEGEERTIESGPVFCLQHFICSFYNITNHIANQKSQQNKNPGQKKEN